MNIFLQKDMNGHTEMYNETTVQAEPLVQSSELFRVLLPGTQVLPLQKKYNSLLKRSFDMITAMFVTVFILSWLVPIVAVIIKLNSKGPVFFIQKRNKRDGAVFSCIKFRTMIVNEEADSIGAYEDDGRITSAGRFLRRTHIDELPQALNVLVGDMSFVGPRPHMLIENRRNEILIDDYDARHRVKPGITGLAQSLGHYGYTEDLQILTVRSMVDLHYIRHWSMRKDLLIIARTFINIFR